MLITPEPLYTAHRDRRFYRGIITAALGAFRVGELVHVMVLGGGAAKTGNSRLASTGSDTLPTHSPGQGGHFAIPFDACKH